MNTPEHIFCLARKDLEPKGFLAGQTAALTSLLALPQHFIPRPEAEKAPAYKQLIPYQVFCCAGKFFVFRRGGGVGEQRLSGRLSIGIGGHINDQDSENGVMTPTALQQAILRERKEELRLNAPVSTLFAGLINDDSDPVGRVHLGAVFRCRVEDEKSIRLGDEEDLHFEGWWTTDEIKKNGDRFEKWSLLALELLNQEGQTDHDNHPDGG